jgi:hypothetical protein
VRRLISLFSPPNRRPFGHLLKLQEAFADGAKKAGPGAPKKAAEKVMPVLHKLMAKTLTEDDKGEISLLGTMIQQVGGINHDDIDQGDDHFTFNKIRFNDKGAVSVFRQVYTRGCHWFSRVLA